MSPGRVPALPASSSMRGWIQGTLPLFLWPLIPQARCHLIFTQRFQCGAKHQLFPPHPQRSLHWLLSLSILIIDQMVPWSWGVYVGAVTNLTQFITGFSIWDWLFDLFLFPTLLGFLDLFCYFIQLHSGFYTLQFEDFLYGTNLFLCSKLLTI